MTFPALGRAYVAWQRAAGPLAPFVNVAPFLNDAFQPVRPRVLGARWLVDALLTGAPSEPHLLLLDLPVAIGLVAAAELNASHGYAIAPAIPRWPARPAMLDSRRLVGLLLALADRLRRPGRGDRLAIVLDGERGGPGLGQGSIPRRILDRRFDNRYRYSLDPLPRADFLAALGVSTLLFAGRSAARADLVGYLQAAERDGIRVTMLNLGQDG